MIAQREARDSNSILEAARHDAVCLPASSRDLLQISGGDSLDLLHRISTNDLSDLGIGDVRETILTNEKGRIVDVLLLARFPDALLALCSAGQGREVLTWIERFTITEDIKGNELTHSVAIVELIGPRAISWASSINGGSLPKNACHIDSSSGARFVTIENTRGSRTFLIGEAGAIRTLLKSLGATLLEPWQADLLRIRLGIPERPNEINGGYNPYDVGLVDLVCFTKGCYIGQEVIARLDTYGKVRRGLVGIEFETVDHCDVPASVIGEEGELGRLTSFTSDPLLRKSFGLAVLKFDGIGDGHGVGINSGQSVLQGHVVHLSSGRNAQ